MVKAKAQDSIHNMSWAKFLIPSIIGFYDFVLCTTYLGEEAAHCIKKDLI